MWVVFPIIIPMIKVSLPFHEEFLCCYFCSDRDLSLCTVPLEMWLFSALRDWLFLIGWGSGSCFLSTCFMVFFKFSFLFPLRFSFYCSPLGSHLTMSSFLFFCIQKCCRLFFLRHPLPKYLRCTGRDFYTPWTWPLWPFHIPLISLIRLSPPLAEASLHCRRWAQPTSLIRLKEDSPNECIEQIFSKMRKTRKWSDY